MIVWLFPNPNYDILHEIGLICQFYSEDNHTISRRCWNIAIEMVRAQFEKSYNIFYSVNDNEQFSNDIIFSSSWLNMIRNQIGKQNQQNRLATLSKQTKRMINYYLIHLDDFSVILLFVWFRMGWFLFCSKVWNALTLTKYLFLS